MLISPSNNSTSFPWDGSCCHLISLPLTISHVLPLKPRSSCLRLPEHPIRQPVTQNASLTFNFVNCCHKGTFGCNHSEELNNIMYNVIGGKSIHHCRDSQVKFDSSQSMSRPLPWILYSKYMCNENEKPIFTSYSEMKWINEPSFNKWTGEMWQRYGYPPPHQRHSHLDLYKLVDIRERIQSLVCNGYFYHALRIYVLHLKYLK